MRMHSGHRQPGQDLTKSLAGEIQQKDTAKWMREKASKAVAADSSSSKDPVNLVKELERLSKQI